MRLYQVFLILFSHFLCWAFGMTSLNLWNGIILMDWMRKKSWTSDDFMWSISMDMPRKRMLNINDTPFDIYGKKMNIDNGNSLFYVSHSCKQFNRANICVENKWIDLDVVVGFIGMVCINVRSPSLKAMIAIPNMKHFSIKLA